MTTTSAAIRSGSRTLRSRTISACFAVTSVSTTRKTTSLSSLALPRAWEPKRIPSEPGGAAVRSNSAAREIVPSSITRRSVSPVEGDRLPAPRALSRDAVRLPHVFPEQFRARRSRQASGKLVQLQQVIPCMVGMREVGGPEEALFAVELHHRRDRVLVRIARDPTLAAE